MTAIFFQCVYNDDEKCWIVIGALGSPIAAEIFSKGCKGIGDTIEEAVSDWKEAMILASVQAQSNER